MKNLLQIMIVLITTALSLNASAWSEKAESTVRPLLSQLEDGRACIAAISDTTCRNQHIRKSILSEVINMENHAGIWRSFSCRFDVRIRELSTKHEIDVPVNSWTEEFQMCTLCAFAPREVVHKEIVDTDVKNARALLLNSSALCQ